MCLKRHRAKRYSKDAWDMAQEALESLQPIREACEQYWSAIPDRDESIKLIADDLDFPTYNEIARKHGLALERENALLREHIELLKEKAELEKPNPAPYFPLFKHHQMEITKFEWPDLICSGHTITYPNTYHGMTDYQMGEPYTVSGSTPFGKEEC